MTLCGRSLVMVLVCGAGALAAVRPAHGQAAVAPGTATGPAPAATPATEPPAAPPPVVPDAPAAGEAPGAAPAPSPAAPAAPKLVVDRAAALPSPAPVAVSDDEDTITVDPYGPPSAAPEGPDPWARPYFVKGDLDSFSTRPTPRRNFIGVAGGLSALPADANTIINSFYLTVEPLVDISNPTYHWKVSLGAPLQFQLVDTRGAFEVCVGEAKALRDMGQTQSNISSATAACMSRQKDRITENFGKLRKADWDEASDFAKIVRNIEIGGQEQPFYLHLSRLYDQSFGHGTVVRHYNPNIDYNTARLGANLDLSRSAVGVQAMANDLVRPDVIGLMGFVRPLRPYSDDVRLRSLSLGVSWVQGSNQPTGLSYERGLFGKSFNQPLPQVDTNLNLIGSGYRAATVLGVDLETKIVRTDSSDLKVYADFDKMLNYDSGITLGTLWRRSFGQPARQALRARAELTEFGPAYLPSYFDTFHDIFQYQYLPMGYKASNGLTYYPTKLEYLDASRGGRRRIGAYGELTHSFLDTFTIGAVLRGWTTYGSPSAAGFTGPQFYDYGSACKPTSAGEGALSCDKKVGPGHEPGFSSLRLHAELPFRRFLQAFASYEAFSSQTEGGLGAFKFNGDNEVFFSGARIMVLPFLFITAEARRYFFLQRLTNVDTQNLTFEQDQNFHSRWTFAINTSLGYEF